MSSPLPANLRHLVNSFGSISEFCRAVAINRQQFNKYLNGSSFPAPRNLRRICNQAGISESDLFLPSKEFIACHDRPRAKSKPSELLSFIESAHAASTDIMRKYEGLYFKYYYSLSKPGLIRKSLMCISISERGTITKCVEPAGTELTRLGIAGLCKYSGEVVFIGDRIFVLEYEYLSKKEISYSVYFPTYMSSAVMLPGLMLGVSASHRHEPAASRVLLTRLSAQYTLREAIRCCGLFDPSSSEVDNTIKELIDNGGSPTDTLFSAPTTEHINYGSLQRLASPRHGRLPR